jgi:hypothetical protein
MILFFLEWMHMQKSLIPVCFLLLTAFGKVQICGQSPNPDANLLSVHQTSGPIRLDGRLDEPAWQEAESVAELVQQSPRPGEPTPYRTRVKVLVGKDALYFGFECADPDPGKIRGAGQTHLAMGFANP